MKCGACGLEPPAGSAFCNGCGARLILTCANCGATPPPDSRFCNGCGATLGVESISASTQAAAGFSGAAVAPEREPRAYTPKHLADKILQSKSALEGERKQVTVLFADVKGSMELAEQLDPEEWHRVLERFFEILTEGVHRFEGTVNQYTGDGIMALFGAPIAHEDHAQRACYAALHLQGTLREYAEELKRKRGLVFAARIGLNSGEVIVGRIGDDLRMDYTAQGHVVGLAQRVESLADPGKTYVAAATAQLAQGYFALRDLGEFVLKGAAAPQHVFELEGTGALRTRFDVSRARGLSRFVGRAAEFATLESALDRAFAGQGSVVGVVAEPGTGKSRLCFELTERARGRGISVREAHGVPHGKQVPFLPVLALLRGLFGIGERDSDAEARQKIAGALILMDAAFERSLPVWFDFLGVPDPARPAPDLPADDRERLVHEGVRRLIRARSERGPGLILLEDLHWFDTASERLLATLVDAMHDTRTLLLLNFRPEFHAEWMQRSGYQQLPLRPLGAEAAAELLRALLGPDPALTPLSERIATHAGGNPFFVEELVQALVEDGSLVGTPGAYTTTREVQALALPATVQAVLAARIDRLGEREKQVLQTAAVIGPEFDAALLARVAQLPEPEILAALRMLAQAELLLERSLYPDVVYGFKHPLTQEVALRTQLASRRAERHAAVARALEEVTVPEQLDERAALLAGHWQEAGEILTAARWRARAGTWAESRTPRGAFEHWRSVCALCDALADSDEVLTLGLHARGRLIWMGYTIGEPTAALRRLLDEARALAARGGQGLAPVVGGYGAALAFNAIDYEEAVSTFDEAIALSEGRNDSRVSFARVLRLAALREAGRLEEAMQAAERLDPAAALTMVLRQFTHANRGRLWFLLGRHHDAQRELDAAIEIAQGEGRVATAWLNFRVELAEFRGDHASVARDAARALETTNPDNTVEQRSALEVHGIARAIAGDWQAAATAFASAHSLEGGTQIARYRLAEAKLELGEHEKARELATTAAAEFAHRRMPLQELATQLVLARVIMRADGLAARDAIEAVLARVEALIAQTGAVVYSPLLHIERAALAKLLGNALGWADELRNAERLFRQFGAPIRADAIARELAAAHADSLEGN